MLILFSAAGRCISDSLYQSPAPSIISYTLSLAAIGHFLIINWEKKELLLQQVNIQIHTNNLKKL